MDTELPMQNPAEALPTEMPQVQQITQDPEDNLGKLLFKLKMVPNFDTLYAIEDDFNSIGMTIQCTTHNRMILCKIINGRPQATKALEDFVFLGTLDNKTQEVPERTLNAIADFVTNLAAEPAKVENSSRKWQRGVHTYGKVIIVHEDVQEIAQAIID